MLQILAYLRHMRGRSVEKLGYVLDSHVSLVLALVRLFAIPKQLHYFDLLTLCVLHFLSSRTLC